MSDVLLEKLFELPRWEHAISVAADKGIDQSLLRELADPRGRLELYRSIRDGKYSVAPPHEAQIPKDDGTMRTVYVNDGIDRVLLSIVNDMLFELCPELVHPRCVSYRKGMGCGKAVKDMSRRIFALSRDDIGVKVDLSKYFDSVPREYIDQVFDYVEDKYGGSAVVRFVRAFYHDDRVVDLSGNLVGKYSSLRQGCAVAAFLADAVLRDVDETMSGPSQDVDYIRYSDDILLVGEGWRPAFDTMSAMLAEKGLALNPKKVQELRKDEWFTFLGFSIRGGDISLSARRIKDFQSEIGRRTMKSGPMDMEKAVRKVNEFLYVGDGTYSWATSVLPVVNVDRDLVVLNGYVMDAIRAAVLGRTRIGGLGADLHGRDGVVSRGPGRHVSSNRGYLPKLCGYMSIRCMRDAMFSSRQAYRTLVAAM